MSSILAIILLILLGILLLFIEFALLPGISVAGIGGIALLGGSVYIAFNSHGTTIGLITLGAILVVVPVLIYRFFRSKSSKRMMLDSAIDGKVNEDTYTDITAGDSGTTISRLSPMGKVRINNKIVEARSTGEMIDPNSRVVVVKVISNQIIVQSYKPS